MIPIPNVDKWDTTSRIYPYIKLSKRSMSKKLLKRKVQGPGTWKYSRKVKSDIVVDQALVAWGNSSSDSDESE